MNVHQITLQGYTASVAPSTDPASNCVSGLYLGTAGSYGVEQLDVIQSTGRENLSVTAIFQPCGIKITVPAEGGVIDVPWEATADMLTYPQGRIVFQGYADNELVNSCDLPYTVSGHSSTEGNNPQPPTPDQYQQFVNEVQASADAAANSATAAAGSATAAAGSASAAANSAQQAADALQQVQAAGQQATQNIQTAQSQAVQAVQNQQQTSVGAVQAAGSAAVDLVNQTGQQQVQAVKDEGAAQTNAVAGAGSAQVQSVEQAGSQQITSIGEAGAQQVQEVNAAGDNKLNQINTAIAHPPQPNTATGFWQIWNAEMGQYEDTTALYQGGYYTPSVAADGTLTWTGSQAGMPALPSANIQGPQGLGVPTPSASNIGQVPTVNNTGDGYLLTGPYAPLEASIRPTANGNPAVCNDSIAWSFQGLAVYGKSTQDGTPSPENPVPIVNAGEGGSVELAVTGKNLLNMSRCLAFSKSYGLTPVIDGDSILISGTATVTMPIATFTILTTNDEFLVGRNFKFSWFSDQAIVSISGLTTNNKINLAMALQQGQLYNFAIKVAVGLEKLDDYEPYTNQLFTILTPSGLPGVPVTSGGNYTDASGQQMKSDYIDFAQQVYCKNTLSFDFDGSSDQDWKLNTYNGGGESAGLIGFQISESGLPDYWSSCDGLLCNLFVGKAGSDLTWKWEGEGIGTDGKNIFCVVNRSFISSVEAWKEYLASHPMTVIFPSLTPITTPLSSEEVAVYRALQTYSGTTVVSTAEPVAGIEARYILDGTAAWNKINAAIAQINNSTAQTSQVVNTMLGAE